MHVMIDLETLSTRADAAFVSIGAATFDGSVETWSITIDLADAMRSGHVEADTFRWWLGQNPNAQSVFLQAGVPVAVALSAFAAWLENLAPKDELFVWSNGAAFDIAILEYAYKTRDMPVPWHFWNVRDLRTLHADAGVPKPKRADDSTAHDAAADAWYQARCAEQYLRVLRGDTETELVGAGSFAMYSFSAESRAMTTLRRFANAMDG